MYVVMQSKVFVIAKISRTTEKTHSGKMFKFIMVDFIWWISAQWITKNQVFQRLLNDMRDCLNKLKKKKGEVKTLYVVFSSTCLYKNTGRQ